MKKLLLISLLYALSACAQKENKIKEIKKLNVLFIIVDDLRPSLGAYNFPDVKTPNIDRLASEGIQFNHAFCNIPVCGASRASLLTGLRPFWPHRFLNYDTWVEKECPDILTLPEHLLNNGYTTVSNGKVFHHLEDKKGVWSESPWKPDTTTRILQFTNPTNVNYFDSASLQYINPKTGSGPYFEAADIPDSLYFDGIVTRKSIEDLKRLSEQEKPFFLAVGFHKPHLPFNAPEKYYDLYDSISIADNRFRPAGLPEQVRNSREIFRYGRLSHYNTLDFHYEARHAYLACVSFIDAQVGLLLRKLKDLNIEGNTIVIIFGDHGWNLGEHNFWGKHNVMYNALNVPLIVKAPGFSTKEIDEIVEFVDIYPTLCEMTGIETPPHLQGKSMVALMNGQHKNWKNTAFAEWQGARTILTDRYSYTYWFEERYNDAQMLFDHKLDPYENENVVDNKEYKENVKELRLTIDSLYSTFNK